MAESYLRTTTNYEQIMERLGTAVLKEELRSAAYAFLHATTPTYRAKELAEAMAFISGSGLNIIIDSFGIDVDPEKFRTTFFNWIDHRRLLHTSAS